MRWWVAAALLVVSSRGWAGPVRVVVDSVHAHNVLHVPGDADPYEYHTVYGYRRAFRALQQRGGQVDEVTRGLINDRRLAGAGLLFLNLVSADLPPFRVAEIQAIQRYVRRGGGLLVITDHSNCYYHGYKLLPLLEGFGIGVPPETACDVPPHTLGPGNGWIAIERFGVHPVTHGVRAVAIQTGGTLSGPYGIGFTSRDAWGDWWSCPPYGNGAAPGYYGNWRRDRNERGGPLQVIAARSYGAGRMVVVADQNLFGDPFLNYADNYRLWLNCAEWLTHGRLRADAPAYLAQGRPRVVAYEQFDHAMWGNSGPRGAYNLFVGLGRRMRIFAESGLQGRQDLVLFAHDQYRLPRGAMDGLVRHMRSGRRVVILGRSAPGAPAADGLLPALTARLGRPVITDADGAAQYQWPGCGRLLLLPGVRAFGNDRQPAPEAKPDEAQRVVLEALAELIKREAGSTGPAR